MVEALTRVCPCLRNICARLFGSSKSGTGEDDHTGNARKRSSEAGARNPDEVDLDSRYSTIPSKPTMTDSQLYTALWSYEAREKDELSFREGDLFRVVVQTGDWWTADKVDANGHPVARGVLPYNYLAPGQSVEAEPWFFGRMNRYEAVKYLLAPENTDGAFLVRLSEKDNIGHVLSVKSNNDVKHFIIQQQADGQFNLELARSFSSLVDLVHHYRSFPLASIPRLGMACVKKQPQTQYLSYSMVDEFELPKEDFILEERLGGGYFSDVYRGKWRNCITVAIKVLKNKSLNQHDIQMEIQVLKKLRHKHLITLYAVCSSSSPYYIITELLEKGDLLTFLRGSEGRKLDESTLINISAQVVEGMAYLESQSCIHRDLAARNVLVGENCFCKVADFGLAQVIKEPVYVSDDKRIPYKWCAPEAIKRGLFSSKSDIWSYGVLLYEIFSYGGEPYPAHSVGELYNLLTSGYRMPSPSRCPKHIYSIMQLCWSYSPEARPSFRELKCHLTNLICSESD